MKIEQPIVTIELIAKLNDCVSGCVIVVYRYYTGHSKSKFIHRHNPGTERFMETGNNTWLNRLQTRGLLVAIHEHDGTIEVIRPSSVPGVAFDDYADRSAIGIAFADGEVFIAANAPTAIITRKRRPKRWHVEISESVVAGPGPVYLSDSFHSLEQAADAVICCYFSDNLSANRMLD